ncbi:hypothetical protein J7E29_10400 [Streptomyces sp. ISL-90]|nr:hypothetical protein [Streptomyces sp. ISL-90]
MDASEGRVLALQRIAYGADATDAERARAVAELAELAELAVRGAGHDEVGRAGAGEDRDEGVGAGAGEEMDSAAAERAANDDDAASWRGRLVRWTAAAGGIGLLFGAALGWVAGQRVPVDSAATVSATPSEEPGTPLEDSDLLPLFDRLPLADESARVASVDEVIDPASVRLLATRVDGPAAYLARTADGENVCLVLVLPAGPSRIECTVDGLLPADGLSILYGAQGYGLAAARLATTGTVSLGLIVTF